MYKSFTLQSYGIPCRGIEYPPLKRIIKFERKVYHLWFPYMQFYSLMGEFFVSATDEPLNKKSTLLNAMLPNGRATGLVCMPDFACGSIKDLVTAYWGSKFNSEILPKPAAMQAFINRNGSWFSKAKFPFLNLACAFSKTDAMLYRMILKTWQKRKEPPSMPPLLSSPFRLHTLERK
jgi:hypothetical protein